MTRPKLRIVEPAVGMADSESFERIVRGDLVGLGELYDRYAEDLWRFSRRAAPQEDAEDVVHTVFVRLVAIAESYDRSVPIARAWLFGVAARVLRERRRSVRRFANAVMGLMPLVENGSRASAAGSLDVDRALDRLSEPKRIVFLLAEVEGFTGPEISEMLNIPIGTVWTRLHHARRELRDQLGGAS